MGPAHRHRHWQDIWACQFEHRIAFWPAALALCLSLPLPTSAAPREPEGLVSTGLRFAVVRRPVQCESDCRGVELHSFPTNLSEVSETGGPKSAS